MKKLVYYLIFLLALVMMLLASSACRSPKTVTYSQATSDSVKLSMRDSTNQHFSFTFDSLVFSTTELTELTDIDLSLSEKERLRAASVCSVSSVVNKNLPCSSVSPVSSVVKNIPCSRLVVYGGEISGETSRCSSQDSTSNKTSSESKTTKIRPSPSSLITHHLSLIIIIAIVLFLLIRLRSSS